MLVFAPLVAAAVWYRRRPETHKRLMLLATVSLLAAAVARLPTALAAAGPPFYFGVVDLLILTAVLYDIITRRKVHPVYVWGGLAILASQVIRLALSGTSAWLTVAAWLTSGRGRAVAPAVGLGMRFSTFAIGAGVSPAPCTSAEPQQQGSIERTIGEGAFFGTHAWPSQSKSPNPVLHHVQRCLTSPSRPYTSSNISRLAWPRRPQIFRAADYAEYVLSGRGLRHSRLYGSDEVIGAIAAWIGKGGQVAAPRALGAATLSYA